MIRKPILIYLLILFATSVNAALDKTTIGWLEKLDASLAKHSYFEKQRVNRIQELKDGMAKATAEGHEFEQMYALYNEYKSYCYDSARHYSYACLLGFHTIRRKNRKLLEARETIAGQLEQLKRSNRQLQEDAKIKNAYSHSLTPEMRIFALIRLGITDSDRISKFLDYSTHTVNTYKTRIKNRSTVDNEQFERLIMEI